MASTAPKKTPDNPAALAKRMADASVPPHVRFGEWAEAWGMDDGEVAELLEATRPDVNRIRTAARSASFNLAAKIEAVMGIPCGHWRDVPENVQQRAKWYAADGKGKKAPAKRKGR
jgi:plasmid maintenance system antidote protein VapI